LIHPVCLPEEPSNDPDKYDEHLAHLIGWGAPADNNGRNSIELRRADIRVYSQRSVTSYFKF